MSLTSRLVSARVEEFDYYTIKIRLMYIFDVYKSYYVDSRLAGWALFDNVPNDDQPHWRRYRRAVAFGLRRRKLASLQKRLTFEGASRCRWMLPLPRRR